MAPLFPLSDRATDVRLGFKTEGIDPTLRQVADLVCARTKERENFKTCIVGHVNCCLQCGPTLRPQPDCGWVLGWCWELVAGGWWIMERHSWCQCWFV
ncbi:hypothetical protein PoB_002988700 [Plakobranchus ocellatus]|uniref:Uncharacterized protein n=1 Tax=Plakobranchus ocellatus TaxID=259542 RepID=A0AAV4A7Y4_9GAST|nr:hypothetical protein PoB_002988700 [Plakobranchus ocellatus]